MDEHLSDQQIIELSKKNPLEVFSCEDGRIALDGKILSKEEAQALKDYHQNPKAFRFALKIANAIDLLNPLLWFKKKIKKP
jgi:hypothetical protein